jgi:hypothetical protein
MIGIYFVASKLFWVKKSFNKIMFIWCLEPLSKLNTEMYI